MAALLYPFYTKHTLLTQGERRFFFLSNFGDSTLRVTYTNTTDDHANTVCHTYFEVGLYHGDVKLYGDTLQDQCSVSIDTIFSRSLLYTAIRAFFDL